MGCKQSRQVKVQPFGKNELRQDLPGKKLKKTESEHDPIEQDIDDQTRRKGKRNKSSKSNRTLGSCGSLEDDQSQESDRGGSAGSKTSKHSNDSGLGDDYKHVITEYSEADKVKKIEEGFEEREIDDLFIAGSACQTRSSAKDKARLEEAMIIQKLREEGLISRPSAQASGGLSFEIVEERRPIPAVLRPPLRLAKLEKRRVKKKQLTEEDIQEKLERAERRRKRKETERLERIKEMERVDQTTSLETFAEYQKKKEEQSQQKQNIVADNREKRLLEKKEKQRERERRAEEVRKRKMLLATETENQEYDPTANPEETPENSFKNQDVSTEETFNDKI
ncbi:hypothetical protein ACJMK2_040726 [Sinanodonta woodiana]|uniref:Uncharacterized protein n=1 Tax=Sinanodonta woodiana TaxID=1069815 RepID=A0ABD3W5K2_SINWO